MLLSTTTVSPYGDEWMLPWHSVCHIADA